MRTEREEDYIRRIQDAVERAQNFWRKHQFALASLNMFQAGELMASLDEETLKTKRTFESLWQWGTPEIEEPWPPAHA